MLTLLQLRVPNMSLFRFFRDHDPKMRWVCESNIDKLIRDKIRTPEDKLKKALEQMWSSRAGIPGEHQADRKLKYLVLLADSKLEKPTDLFKMVLTDKINLLDFSHFFEKYKISHHILLDFEDHNHANSTHIFNIAGIFTFIYCVLFAIYALSLSDYIKFNIFPERYLGLIIWCLFFMFLFNPFPTKYHKTRIYIIKTIIKSFLNPLLKVPLVVIFTTCQQLALITSF